MPRPVSRRTPPAHAPCKAGSATLTAGMKSLAIIIGVGRRTGSGERWRGDSRQVA